MKRIFFSLLAWGICVSTFAQIDTSNKISPGNSDKWVITPVKNMKGVLGQLDMNFPAGLDWNIGNLAITRQADNKHITSFSGLVLRTKKLYNIAPDEYLIHLNNLPVENVPIQKGHITRLKTGILNITHEGRWEIYNESKEKYLTSYNKPLRFVAPVGKYTLSINGQDQVIEVIDEVTNPESKVIEQTDEWVITRAEDLRTNMGRLNLDFPAGFAWNIRIINGNLFSGNDIDTSFSESSGIKSYILEPHEHYVVVINDAQVRGLPIRKDAETRIKAGFFNLDFEGYWRIIDENIVPADITNHGPVKLVLPVRTYKVKIQGLHPMGSGPQLPEKIQDKKLTTLEIKSGFLDLVSTSFFSVSTVSKGAAILLFNGNGPRKLTLPIGNYKLLLNYQTSHLITIKAGETLTF